MMKVPFADLKELHKTIEPEIQNAVSRVLESGRFVKGPEVRKFEEAFAAFCKARHCVGCSSGTSAIHTALWALGIGEGDEVLVPSHTFVATAEGIVHAGAKPIFVDIDEETYSIDPDKIKEKITERTKAIVVVHLYGQPADIDNILYVARQHELWIVEDAAQAVGAIYKGRPVGVLGDVACFSFFPGKNLGAMGDAGAIVTNDTTLAEKSRMFIDHGRKDKFVHEFIGYNYRMDEIQGAVLRTKLPHLKLWNEVRRNVVLSYRNIMQDKPTLYGKIILPKEYPGTYGVFHLFVIRAKERDKLRTYLLEHEIETGIHYPLPVHMQPPFMEGDQPTTSLPVTEKVCDEILSLPVHPLLTQDQISYVVDTMEQFYG
jgi:dTDP-4-amino-4,6-dideoxygalactose transaminase